MFLDTIPPSHFLSLFVIALLSKDDIVSFSHVVRLMDTLLHCIEWLALLHFGIQFHFGWSSVQDLWHALRWMIM